MLLFILCHDLLFIFLTWDLLGLISYLLINYWSCKVNCGIKAIIYNRLGDISMLYLISIFYSLFSILGYYAFISIDLIILLINLFYCYFYSIIFNIIILISLLLILFTKSAQFPFTSWLLNAMNAPTPISALIPILVGLITEFRSKIFNENTTFKPEIIFDGIILINHNKEPENHTLIRSIHFVLED